MNVSRIGVHESVEVIFPPELLVEELGDRVGGVDGVRIVGDDPAELSAVELVITARHREVFLDTVDWIHVIFSGVDHFPVETIEAADVTLTNSTGIHGTSVGETVAGYLLSFARGQHRYVRSQQRREWDRPAWDDLFTVDGETICVVGLGTLGRGIAERAHGLGMTVTGVRRSGEPVDGVDRVYTPDDLHEAIADARFVALAIPLTEETHHLVGRTELTTMRDDAYLVNVARGSVVDEEALIDALREGEIAGAGLDVFEEEPLPEDSPLWGMENVIVTPHCSGTTRDYYRAVAGVVERNVERSADGRPLDNRVV